MRKPVKTILLWLSSGRLALVNFPQTLSNKANL
jgi:hypothetical protein